MSTNDQPDELGGTHVSGTGWMYEGPNNEINKEVFLSKSFFWKPVTYSVSLGISTGKANWKEL